MMSIDLPTSIEPQITEGEAVIRLIKAGLDAQV